MMTIRVKIGPVEKDIADADPNWINEQINRTRGHGDSLCVQVRIEAESAGLILATSDCPHFRGSDSSLTAQEKEILSLWHKHHLDEKNFSGGNLVAFLKQIQH